MLTASRACGCRHHHAVPTALILWRGPAIAAWLSPRLGGSRDAFAAAVWIYLATAASLVVTIGVAVLDLIAGVIALASPTLAGGLAWLVALVGTLAVLASASALARSVLAVPGPVRALTLTVAWLLLLLAVGLTASLPILAWTS